MERISNRDNFVQEKLDSTFPDPKYDAVFKSLFGKEENKVLTISLLSAILDFNIRDVHFIDSEGRPDCQDGKVIHYDIICEDDEGNRYYLEMQIEEHPGIMDRAMYYLFRSFRNRLKRGEKYVGIKGIYGVFILFSDVGDSKGSDYIKDFRFINIYNLDERYDALRQIFVNLSRFVKTEGECGTLADKWLYNLKHMGQMRTIAFQDKERIFSELDRIARDERMDPDEQNRYMRSLEHSLDYIETMEYHQKMGLQEGRKQVLRNMLGKNFDTETILSVMGISTEELAELKAAL